MFDALRRRIEFARFYTLYRRGLPTIERWQKRKLRAVIKLARTSVPLYRNLYESNALTEETITRVADLARFPIVNKKSFLDKPIEYYTNNDHPLTGYWRTTSGTSGKPFTVINSKLALHQNFIQFACFRVLPPTLGMLKDSRDMRIAWIRVERRPPPNQVCIPVSKWTADPDAVYKELIDFRPDIITSYASILVELANYVKTKNPSDLLSARYIYSFGEALNPLSRKLIGETLHAEVFDRYGADEIGPIAVECSMHNGMHVNIESVIIEVVDDARRPCPPGTAGHVIATDLYNFNMPFIRYDTGDHGVLSYEPCGCGLKSPRLWISGRYSASLTFGEQTIHHLEFDYVMDVFMNSVYQYQVIKTAPDALRIDLVAGPAYAEQTDKDILARMRDLVGDHIAVRVHRVSAIKPTPRGKCSIVVDETVQT